MRTIVDGLRTFARNDIIENKLISINDALSKTISLIREMYEREGIKISITHYDEIFYTMGDFGKLQQIIMNLLSNAKDATIGRGKPQISILLNKTTPNSVTLSIHDNGCGIPEGIKDKILEPFFTTKGLNTGTGIGLGLVVGFLKTMNSKLIIESTLEKGSTFSVVFPLTEAIAPKPEPIQEPEQEKLSLKGKALVVDDESELREILKDYLEGFGLLVDEADDGDTALEQVKLNKYDYICTDMKMPRLNGEDFIKIARNLPYGNTAYLIITGGVITDGSTSKEFYLRKLCDEYILKPFSEEDVYKSLIRVKNATDFSLLTGK